MIVLLSGFFLTSVAQIKPTGAAERVNGLHKRKLLEDNAPFKNITWRNIGPTQMNGRVVDIEVNPADPIEFYVAYASGGLWHTVNNGLSFVPIFEKEDAYSIGDIAVNWSSGSVGSRVIWVGTGEANSSRSSYSGMGVYKSVNNGKSWEYAGLPESHHIGEIILHPSNDNIAWVAVLGHLYSPNKERGVYKTTDGGKNWQQTLVIDDNTGAVEMDINLQNPDELYACTWYRTRSAWDFEPSGKTSGIYKSSDGGNNWKLITQPGSGFPAGQGVGRIGVAVSQKNPEIVYAVVDNNSIKPDTTTKISDTSGYAIREFKNISRENFLKLDDNKLDSFLLKKSFPAKYTPAVIKSLIETGKLKPTVIYDWLIADDGFQNEGIFGCEVYRSDNAGQNWRKVNTKDIGVFSSYGYYFGKIFVSPEDENKVVTFGTGIIVSTDGGKTFTEVDKNNTHLDWHACWINPKKDSHWIAGNDGGCNITYDNGNKWFKVTSVPAGQFYGITTDDASPYHVYGGLQDNGSWFGSSSTAKGSAFAGKKEKEPGPEEYEWKSIGGGDGMQVQVDTRDNKTVYLGFQFGFYSRKNTDSGKPVSIHPMHDLGDAKLRYNWQTPILLSKHNQDVFYYGSNKLHRSLNKGENLVPLSGDLTNGKKNGKIPYGTITTISESPLKFGLLYAGTDDGKIQVSKDGGYTWTLVNNGLPSNLWVSRVTASLHKEGRVYATLNGYRYDNFSPWLYISEDYGSSWKQMGTDLPAEPLNVVKEDIKKEDIIYVGSDNGLYTSFDKGKNFMSMSQHLPRVPIHDLVIQERENELVVGTHGRSIYITKLDSVYKLYDKMIKAQQMKASLQTFDPRQMNDGELNIDCPPAKPPKRKKRLTVVKQ
ncbi:MAG: glycosyl hydrolase [Ferruginibacter sp.]|nr:glycosyl hydrolase [Ferruginibacter sp.]